MGWLVLGLPVLLEELVDVLVDPRVQLVLHLDLMPIPLHEPVFRQEAALELEESEAFLENVPFMAITDVNRVLFHRALREVLDAPRPRVHPILLLEPLHIALNHQVLAVLDASAGGRLDGVDFVQILEGAQAPLEYGRLDFVFGRSVGETKQFCQFTLQIRVIL